jgi:amino acid permease
MRNKRRDSKNRLYLVAFIVIVALVIWLGTKEVDLNAEKISVDVTEQITANK